jgi:hypothetical protein
LNRAIAKRSVSATIDLINIFLHSLQNQSHAYHLAQKYATDQEENIEDVVEKFLLPEVPYYLPKSIHLY